MATSVYTSPESKEHNSPRLLAALQGQKSIFKVSKYQPGARSSRQTGDRTYHARRPHQKSRGGCMKCKERRVKCDETKPHCLRCQKYGVDCIYEEGSKHHQDVVSYLIEKVPSLVSPDSTAYSMSLVAVSSKINELLRVKPKRGNLSDPVRALHHFHEHTAPVVNGKSIHSIPRGKMIQLALDSPFLMHSILATAISHLCYALPDNSSYTAVEAYHWQQAISQYSQEIAHVRSENMDALFSACFLMTTHSFRLETCDPRSSFVFSNDPESLNWLMLQSGLRHLLSLAQPWLYRSVWFELFMESRQSNPLFDDHRSGREGLDPAFADICAIDDSSTEGSNPYLWPLRMLTPILAAERSMRSFSMYTNFMGRLDSSFYERLLRRDPPALLILAWWLGLAHSARQWWMETRIRSECTAICMYLEDSDDPRVLALLEFPAETCGYLLRHVQERMNL
ncbi:hypothetical protein EYZ11_004066 [Aspergillus tanneri]|uniref:Zn(2)-C6 fungal-type domain-containing protein n=1 Tax=Aspergillus tanneri TaxID=1220188 RepID=A0A4S3JLY9_9EURO|nr:uncharacterized protein ATNIH1004_006138 [Aspergillus tanneri]KAA8647445.1 hypothetical protein ATNIH1004_006138 [Aspergillus tanneri]THC96475.1 hypothetical protein EYZ11_004066 [Aspergillus tanneri]